MIGRLAAYARLFHSPADAYRYAQLRRRHRAGSAGPAAQLRLRALGGAAVVCRPGQDVWTLKHTFLEGFHQPPAELPRSAVIVDLGTNVGYTVADLAHRHPDARIVGVELDAENYEIARRNTARYGDRVTLVHAAVWTENGTVAYGGEAADAFHVTPGDPPRGARTAPALTLAALFDRLGLERVDYVKMDVEGAEAAILAAPLDWADRVQSLKIELHPPAELDACRAALEGRGFSCGRDARHPHCLVAVRR